MNPIIVVAFLLILYGCSSVQTTEWDAQTQTKALEIQKIEVLQPTIEIRCDTGCKGLFFVYNDPKKIRMKLPATSADVAIEQVRATEGVIRAIVPVAAAAWVGGKVVDALEGSGAVYNMVTKEGDNQVGNNSSSIGGDDIGGDSIGSIDSHNVDSHDVNTVDSHDTNTIDSNDNYSTDSHDFTDSNDSYTDTSDNSSDDYSTSDSHDDNSTVTDDHSDNSTIIDDHSDNSIDNSVEQAPLP